LGRRLDVFGRRPERQLRRTVDDQSAFERGLLGTGRRPPRLGVGNLFGAHRQASFLGIRIGHDGERSQQQQAGKRAFHRVVRCHKCANDTTGERALLSAPFTVRLVRPKIE
jgi:hypothetical protein